MIRLLGRLSLLVLVGGLVGLPGVARAQTSPTVDLVVSDTRFPFGTTVKLSGNITPRTEGQTVNLIDEEAKVLASATTDDRGHYAVRLTPRANVTLRAEWAGTLSEPADLKVRPLLSVKLVDVRLFDTARSWGKLAPGVDGARVTLRLRRYGRVVKEHSAKVSGAGWFKSKFRIEEPGTYKVTATYRDADHLPAKDGTVTRKTVLPNLSSGSRSPYVKVLERRLRQLNYKVPHPNQKFDFRTSDAVIAFNKVQGRPRQGYVTDSTWRALASPKIPKPRFARPKYHIEVDQTKQVLYRVKDNEVITILHVSTGAGSATRDGTFRFWSKLAGYSRKRLYYPSFFDGGRAIHGWPEVPTYNASHGCVRIPMWTAVWMFGKSEIGDTIRIYHS